MCKYSCISTCLKKIDFMCATHETVCVTMTSGKVVVTEVPKMGSDTLKVTHSRK